MSRKSPERLAQSAARARSRGDYESALRAYLELEQAEPLSGTWPMRAGEMQLWLAQIDEARESFERAARCFEGAGAELQAVAAYQRVLSLAPGRQDLRNRLAALAGAESRAAVEPSGRGALRAETTRAPQPQVAAAAAQPDLAAPAPEPDALLTEAIARSESPGDAAPVARFAFDLEDDEPIFESRLPSAAPPSQAEQLALRVLPQASVFAELGAAALERVARLVQLEFALEGDVVFRAGEPSTALYIVAEGAVVPIAEGPERKKLAVLEAGSVFGEMGLLSGEVRSASVEALVDSKLLRLDKDHAQELLRESPAVLRALMRCFRKRWADRLLRTNPLFRDLPPAECQQIAREFRLLEAQVPTLLVQQGQRSPALFALLAGEVQVIHASPEGGRRIARLGPGDFFGEMSLVRGEVAEASVVASRRCFLLALPSDGLERLLALEPDFRERLEALVLERAQRNRERRGRGVDADLDLV
jgi:CRP-like cAMP-binding protein